MAGAKISFLPSPVPEKPRIRARFRSRQQPAPIVHLQTLQLTHFKNYTRQALELSPRLNCFVGLNGMGKTNALDAVYFLCLLRSHRGLPDKNLVQQDADFFRLEGRFEHAGEQRKIVVKYAAGQRKEVEQNGSPFTRLSDYIGQFPAVMIAPEDIALVQDGSEERRRFLDATLAQISTEYLDQLLRYNQLLKQRNALLKAFAEHRRFDPTLLESIDQQMPETVACIDRQRRNFATAFTPVFQELYRAIAGENEPVAISLETRPADTDFAETLRQNLEKDRAQERTSEGPHRDDLSLHLRDQPVKKYASQGQLKSFLLALRLAQYELLRREKGVAPLLLLDDIFDKLDEQRVRQLMVLLHERQFGQTYITDTQRSRLEPVLEYYSGAYRMFEVREGNIGNAE